MKGLLGLGFKDFWAYYPTTLLTVYSALFPNKSSSLIQSYPASLLYAYSVLIILLYG
jgi:hypothetical protein